MQFTPFLGALLGNIIVAVGIIIIILFIKFIKNKFINFIDYITALTVGLLLGIIFLGFLPELTHSGLDGDHIGLTMLLGVFIFYLLELFLHWHHCKDLGHGESCQINNHHEKESNMLIFGGTFLHNVFHGIVLFSAFSVDFYFGIATTLAVLLHAIPQNVVNYIMNHEKTKYAYFAAFGGVFGALLTYPFADILVENKFYILALIAGGLLYTALADIFPEFKEKGTTMKKVSYLIFIIIGIWAFVGFESIADSGHEEESNIAYECLEHGGKWLEEVSECEGVSNKVCSELGGNFNECASACRNNPEAEICTLQCVQVCEFNN